ncbi:MAG: hypothetical protein FWC43_01545 [Planctomycetaceae bacterium]|nr:hypothetical protein [Planctomycetaceae bacterium]
MQDFFRNSTDLNRVFPTGVKVGKTRYGLGVFSYAFIPAGTPIGRARGTVIHDGEYSSDYCIAAGDGMVLEPAPPFCYLNHSCEPNCSLMHYVTEDEFDGTEIEGNLANDELHSYSSITTGDFYGEDADPFGELTEDDECCFGDGGVAQIDGGESGDFGDSFENEEEVEEPEYNDDENGIEIWVETTRDILPGEELTIDYAWPADRAMKCLCGAKTCRGWIVDPEALDELVFQET